MKYFYTLTILFILSANLINAQSSFYIQSGTGLTEAFQRSAPPQENISEIRGTPYLSPNWENGIVTLNNDKKFEGQLRYNIYNQQIELLHKNNFLSINAPNKIKEIWIGARKNIYSPIIEEKKGNQFIFTGYLEILVEGKVNLLLYRDANIKEDPSTPRHPSGMNPGKSYVVKKSYYFQTKKNGSALEFERKKKSLFELFGDKKSEISFFMKEKKMKRLNDAEIVEVFNYYNKINIENTKAGSNLSNLKTKE